MIYPVTMYEAKCDGCGKKWNDGEMTYPDTHCLSQMIGEECEWHTDTFGGTEMHFCPDCWSWSEDGEIVLKKTPNTNV